MSIPTYFRRVSNFESRNRFIQQIGWVKVLNSTANRSCDSNIFKLIYSVKYENGRHGLNTGLPHTDMREHFQPVVPTKRGRLVKNPTARFDSPNFDCGRTSLEDLFEFVIFQN